MSKLKHCNQKLRRIPRKRSIREEKSTGRQLLDGHDKVDMDDKTDLLGYTVSRGWQLLLPGDCVSSIQKTGTL